MSLLFYTENTDTKPPLCQVSALHGLEELGNNTTNNSPRQVFCNAELFLNIQMFFCLLINKEINRGMNAACITRKWWHANITWAPSSSFSSLPGWQCGFVGHIYLLYVLYLSLSSTAHVFHHYGSENNTHHRNG